MAGLNKKQLAEALTAITGHLDVKFDGRAFLSLAGGHYMLSVRELTGIEHFSSKDPTEVIGRLLPKDDSVRVSTQVEEIYAAYPRRRDPGSAKLAIKTALIDPEIPHPDRFAYLLAAVQLYAASQQERGEDRTNFIPYPATWMRRKSYLNAPKMVLAWMAGARLAAKLTPRDWSARPGDAQS